MFTRDGAGYLTPRCCDSIRVSGKVNARFYVEAQYVISFRDRTWRVRYGYAFLPVANVP